MTSLNRSRAESSVLAENLEHYNAQLDTPVSDHWDLMDLSVERTPEENRWVRKITRDINNPYSDVDVAEQLKTVDNDLVELVRVKGSKFPSKLFVTGSINKGRFGGNSDLDVIGEGLLSDHSCEQLAAKPGWKVFTSASEGGETVMQSVTSPGGLHVDFFETPDFAKVSKFYGAHYVVDVAKAQAGDTGIADTAVKGFESKGFEVEQSDKALSLHRNGSVKIPKEDGKVYPKDVSHRLSKF